jgi:hypothetical protein
MAVWHVCGTPSRSTVNCRLLWPDPCRLIISTIWPRIPREPKVWLHWMSSTHSFGSRDPAGSFPGEREIEGRAGTGCAVGPGAASVPFHDLSHARQTDAGAGELGG